MKKNNNVSHETKKPPPKEGAFLVKKNFY